MIAASKVCTDLAVQRTTKAKDFAKGHGQKHRWRPRVRATHHSVSNRGGPDIKFLRSDLFKTIVEPPEVDWRVVFFLLDMVLFEVQKLDSWMFAKEGSNRIERKN